MVHESHSSPGYAAAKVLSDCHRLLMAITLLGFAVAGGARAASLEEIAKLSGPDRQKILEEGARKEGQLNWYTTLGVEQVVIPLNDEFQRRYPYIVSKYIRSTSPQILVRATAEARARSVRVDVVQADVADGMKDAGLAQPFNSPVMDEYPASYIDPDREWVSFRTSWQGIAWNTNLVSAADAPKDWEGLINPKFKGKIAWPENPASGAARYITHFRVMWGEDKALAYLKQLQAMDIRTSSGSTETLMDQVATGEYAVGLTSMHLVAFAKEKGATVDGLNPEPALAKSGTVALLKGAPNPHAAMLFLDFLLSKDGGQKVLRESGYSPANPAVQPLPTLQWIQPNLTGKKEIMLRPSQERELLAKSAQLYKSMFK